MLSRLAVRALRTSTTASSLPGCRLSAYRPLSIRSTINETMASAMAADNSDIVSQIIQDHREAETYYQKLKESVTAEDSNKWFNQLVWEISRHSVAEELVLYPMMEKLGETGKRYADESRKEHHMVKELLSNAKTAQANGTPDDLEKAVDEVVKTLFLHMEKEEKEELPYFTNNTDLQDRQKAGAMFSRRKKIVPTRPHTAVSEKHAALEGALGLMLAPLDKMRDMFSSFPDEQELKNA